MLHDTLVELYPPSLDTADAPQTATEDQPPPKKLKGRYASKLSSPGVSNAGHDRSLDGQIQRFFSWNHGEVSADGAIDPIIFWTGEKAKQELPNLSKLACRVLSIPASSAPVERVFSHGSIILRPHRATMNDEHLSDLIVLKCNRLGKR